MTRCMNEMGPDGPTRGKVIENMENEENELIYAFAPNNPRSKANKYLSEQGIEDIFRVNFRVYK